MSLKQNEKRRDDEFKGVIVILNISTEVLKTKGRIEIHPFGILFIHHQT